MKLGIFPPAHVVTELILLVAMSAVSNRASLTVLLDAATRDLSLTPGWRDA